MRQTVLLILLAFSTPLLANDTSITISNAWVRAAPPTVSMRAGYATLHNSSDTATTLVKITSPQFGMVQLHESFIENGMSRMRHVPALVIAAGNTLRFEPGGYHLMLMQAKAAIKLNDTIRFVFYFSNGETMAIDAIVRRVTGHEHQK